LAFSPRLVHGRTGVADVAVTNHDLFWHTFTIARLGVDARVPIGGTRRVHIEAAAGTYRFICRIPGHEGAGMSGTLIIT
jgi:plastocyanin